MKEETIYENLRQQLDKAIENGDSQNGIAKQANVKHPSLQRFLTGKQASFSGNNLIRLLDYVGAYIVFDGESAQAAGSADLAAITQERDELLKKCQEQEKRIGELEAEIRGMKTAMEYMRPHPDSLATAAEGRKAG